MFRSSKILSYLYVLSSVLLALTILKEDHTLEELHLKHIKNSPFEEVKGLNKHQRFEKGLPPNKFHEQIFELIINPRTGVPDYQSKIDLENELDLIRKGPKPLAVPGDTEKPWYELGPNDAAGRSRAALWDLSDGANQRVFAGGVSGGLWKNENVTSVASPWSRVNIPIGNLAVSVIIQDPDNTNVMYLGTGEKYTSGDASGNGIYKSVDGGSRA